MLAAPKYFADGACYGLLSTVTICYGLGPRLLLNHNQQMGEIVPSFLEQKGLHDDFWSWAKARLFPWKTNAPQMFQVWQSAFWKELKTSRLKWANYTTPRALSLRLDGLEIAIFCESWNETRDRCWVKHPFFEKSVNQIMTKRKKNASESFSSLLYLAMAFS